MAILFDKAYALSSHVVADIHKDLKHIMPRLKFGEATQDAFLLATSEIVTNALKHTDDKPFAFKLQIDFVHHDYYFTIMDNGNKFTEFDRMRALSHDKTMAFKDGHLESGGLGLFLAGRGFDDFQYQYENHWNCYRFKLHDPNHLSKPHILIIDDDAIQRDLLTAYLKDDYVVHHEHSGQAGAHFLENTERLPDLILCDVVMRDGDGISFCKSMQSNKDHALIPFIFMTGHPDDLAAQVAEDLPVNDFLQKPVHKEHLLKSLKRTLQKSQQDRKIINDRLDHDITDILSPSLPEQIGAFRCALHWQAAEVGGGDIVFNVKGENCDHIIVIDVMGHGIEAKFFGHSFAGYIRGFLSAHANIDDPAEILRSLSQFLYHDKIGQKTILTAQIATIRDNIITIASAGHPPPFILKNDTLEEASITGTMPGLNPDEEYETVTINMKDHTRLILYTDGIMEIGDNSTEMENHRIETIKKLKEKNINALFNFFKLKHEEFSQDDMTIIVITPD